MKKIFVSIVSYRDPLLLTTIRSLLENASGNNDIIIGVFEQTIHENSLESKDIGIIECGALKYKRIDPQYTQGVGWARAINDMQITDEDFIYQIDSHMCFDKNWDIVLLNDYRNACSIYDTSKIVIGNACKNYWIESVDDNPNTIVLEGTGNDKVTSRVKYCMWQNNNIPAAHGERIHGRSFKLENCIHLCAGNLFAPIQWVEDVGNSSKFFFEGEEGRLTLESFIKGYKILHGTEIISYHYNDSGNHLTKLWKDPVISIEKYNSLYTIGIENWEKYLKSVPESQLQKFYEYSGVDYINQKLDERAITREILPPDDLEFPYDFGLRKKHQYIKRAQIDLDIFRDNDIFTIHNL